MEEPGGLQSVGLLRVRHDFTFTFHFHALEKEMATHPSILAWRIPWTEEPGGLQSVGLQRVGHKRSDLACTHLNESLSTNVPGCIIHSSQEVETAQVPFS